jgi:hypothetical protein
MTPKRSNRHVELKPRAGFVKKMQASKFPSEGTTNLTLEEFLNLQQHIQTNPAVASVKITPPKYKDVNHE